MKKLVVWPFVEDPKKTVLPPQRFALLSREKWKDSDFMCVPMLLSVIFYETLFESMYIVISKVILNVLYFSLYIAIFMFK